MNPRNTLIGIALATLICTGSVANAEDGGPVIIGGLKSNLSSNGALTALSVGEGSAMVEANTITGNVRVEGDTELNASVNGAVTALAVSDGCAGVRLNSIAETQQCKPGGGGGGGSLLGKIAKSILPF